MRTILPHSVINYCVRQAGLQARLDQASERVEALQRQVAEQERTDGPSAREDRTQSGSHLVVGRGARAPRVKRRDRCTQLALIREGNEERATLRREPAGATRSKARPRLIAQTIVGPPEDEDATEELPTLASARL